MDNLTFITTVAPGRSLLDLQLLLASIRDFGGSLAETPIWVCLPQNHADVPDQVRDYFETLEVGLLNFQIDGEVQSFPFGARVQAAAVAEKAFSSKTSLLAWLDSDTIVLQDPTELLLPPGKVLGYRPVHHRLLGTAWGEDLDPFWELIYHKCQATIDPDDFMVTHAGEKIRPYFNAGSFVIRPEAGLLERWWQVFREQLRSPDFLSFYGKDQLYPIFMHQVIFTGVLLAAIDKGRRLEFSSKINYPLHLHWEIPEQHRAELINDLITVRCENILNEPGWQEHLPIQEPLLSWLENQLNLKKSLGASP